MRTPDIKLINATIECCNAAKIFTTTQIRSDLQRNGFTASYDHINVTFRRWLEAGKILRLRGGMRGRPAVYSINNPLPLRPIPKARQESEPKLSPTETAWRAFRMEMERNTTPSYERANS